MKTRNVLIVVAGLIIIAFLFSPSPEPVSPKVVRGTKIEGKAFRDAFMENCVSVDTDEEYCGCAYRYLQRNNSLEEVMEVYDQGDEAMIEFMTPAALNCLEFLDI